MAVTEMTKIVFRTSNGSTFTEKEAALEYEAAYELLKLMNAYLVGASITKAEVSKFIIQNKMKIWEILENLTDKEISEDAGIAQG